MGDSPPVGARVHVPGLGTGIVRERRGARAVVDIKGLPVVIDAARLSIAQAPRRRARAAETMAPPAPPRERGSASLDLHGKTVAEAVDALEVFVNEALLDGRESVVVIHGRSGGRVRHAVHAFLKRVPTVRTFQIDPVNEGQTIVRF